jgi:hypothetical protein
MMVRLVRFVETGLLLLLLVVLGVVHFSEITQQERIGIELQAGLEQLYALEQAHFERFGRYFDPEGSVAGLEWKWLESYDWEMKGQESGFWIAARADLDGDGEDGIWYLDEASQLQALVAD